MHAWKNHEENGVLTYDNKPESIQKEMHTICYEQWLVMQDVFVNRYIIDYDNFTVSLLVEIHFSKASQRNQFKRSIRLQCKEKYNKSKFLKIKILRMMSE